MSCKAMGGPPFFMYPILLVVFGCLAVVNVCKNVCTSVYTNVTYLVGGTSEVTEGSSEVTEGSNESSVHRD